MQSLRKILTALVVIGLLSACSPANPIVTEQPTSAPTAESQVTSTAESLETSTITPPISLKVGIFNYISYAPLFIAFEEGFFAEQGLDVEFIDFGSQSSEFIPALLSKQLDVAPYPLSSSVFNAILSGVNVKYVADKGFLNPTSCVTDAFVASDISLANGNITDVASLAGKRMTSIPGGTFEYALDVLLTQGGLIQDDVELTTINDSATRVQALASDSLDVSVLSEPWITRAQTQKAGTVWMPLATLLPNYSLGAMVYGPSMLERDLDVGVRFMTAYLKGVGQFNQGKTDRNVEIIANYTKLTQEEIKIACWTNFKPDGTIDVESMLGFVQWTVDKGYVDLALTSEQILDNRFVEQAYELLNP